MEIAALALTFDTAIIEGLGGLGMDL